MLALPKNDSIMQSTLFIIIRRVQMVAQLRVGSIFFLSILVPMRWIFTKNIFWNIGSEERRTWLVTLIVFTRSL